MIKKVLYIAVTVFMITSVSFASFAENGDEYYEEYDNYYEFEQDYYDSVVFPEEKNDGQWYNELSPIPPVIGLFSGALTVLILYRRQNAARKQRPEQIGYNYAPNIKHTTESDTNENSL